MHLGGVPQPEGLGGATVCGGGWRAAGHIAGADRSGAAGPEPADSAEDAEPDQAFVLRADGSIIARRDHNGMFGGSFESIQVMPGDTVVVPAQLDRESRYNFVVRALKDWTQILSNLGIGVAAINSITK